MKGKGIYKIIKNKELIVQFYSGDIIIDNIIYVQKIMSDELNYNPNFDIIVDFREANLLFSEEVLNGYMDFLNKHTKIHGKRKAAYISSKPNEAVLTLLFSKLVIDISVQAYVFSTIEATANWLNKEGVDSQFLSLVIDELRAQPDQRIIV